MTMHEAATLTGGKVPAHVPGAYPRLSCCGGPVALVRVPHYPTGAELNALRCEFALADPRAAFHELAKARIARGMPWDGREGSAGRTRADESERLYGIGGSWIGEMHRRQDWYRAVKPGLVLA